MIIYNDNNIEECKSKYIYGPVSIYKKYEIRDRYIYGIGKVSKGYISVDSDKFLKETRKVGKMLFAEYSEYLTPLNVIKRDGHYLEEPFHSALIKYEHLIKNQPSKELSILLDDFFQKYGLPMSFDDVSENDSTFQNDIETIYTLFLLTYMLPCLNTYHYETHEIKKIKELLNFDNLTNTNSFICNFLNDNIKNIYSVHDFRLCFIKNYPVFITKNIFSFAFKAIIFDIFDKHKKTKIKTNVCQDCGEVLYGNKEYYTDNRYIKPHKCCDKCQSIRRTNTHAKVYEAKKQKLEEIKVLRLELQKLDKSRTYQELLKEANALNNVHHILLKGTKNKKTHDELIDRLYIAINQLKNDRN